MEIRKIISEFKKIRDEENLQITDTTIFTEALDLFISMGIQTGYKDLLGKPKITQPQASNKEIDPITEAQKRKLYVLKYKGAIPKTKQEAYKLIKKLSE